MKRNKAKEKGDNGKKKGKTNKTPLRYIHSS